MCFLIKKDYALGNKAQNPINCRLMESMKWPLKDQSVCNFCMAEPSWELMLIITSSHNNHKKSWTSGIQRVMGSIALWMHISLRSRQAMPLACYVDIKSAITQVVCVGYCGALYQQCNLKFRNMYNIHECCILNSQVTLWSPSCAE